MEEIYETENNIYIISRLNGETDEYFYEKCRYIGDKEPKNETEFKEVLLEAQLYCNKKFLGCIY